MSGANRSLALRVLGPQRFPARTSSARTLARLAAGFTLLELIIACSILLVLAGIAIPLARVAIKRRKEADLRYDLREMRTPSTAIKTRRTRI